MIISKASIQKRARTDVLRALEAPHAVIDKPAIVYPDNPDAQAVYEEACMQEIMSRIELAEA